MQKARGHPDVLPKKAPRLPLLVGTRFQDLFHPPPGVLFIFPSRYSFTIGHGRVFSLDRWSCQIQPGFLVSRHTQETVLSLGVSVTPTGPSPSVARLSSRIRLLDTLTPGAGRLPANCSYYPVTATAAALTPRRFGLFPVRSPLLRE